jgi:hypothetical protein
MSKFEMPEGTVCFHIPTRGNLPKRVSNEAYLKMVGRKGYFCGYIQGDAICFVNGDSVIVIRKNQLENIEKFGGWMV